MAAPAVYEWQSSRDLLVAAGGTTPATAHVWNLDQEICQDQVGESSGFRSREGPGPFDQMSMYRGCRALGVGVRAWPLRSLRPSTARGLGTACSDKRCVSSCDCSASSRAAVGLVPPCTGSAVPTLPCGCPRAQFPAAKPYRNSPELWPSTYHNVPELQPFAGSGEGPGRQRRALAAAGHDAGGAAAAVCRRHRRHRFPLRPARARRPGRGAGAPSRRAPGALLLWPVQGLSPWKPQAVGKT